MYVSNCAKPPVRAPQTKPLNRIRILKSVARHLASCNKSDLESPRWVGLLNDVMSSLINCYEAAPKRHRPQFVIPAQDVLFTLERLRTQQLNPALRARLKSLGAPAVNDQPLPTTGLSAEVLSRRRHGRTRYFEAEEMHVELDLPQQPVHPPSKSAILAQAGAAYSLPELVTKLSQDPAFAQALLATLPEVTPVLEALCSQALNTNTQ